MSFLPGKFTAFAASKFRHSGPDCLATSNDLDERLVRAAQQTGYRRDARLHAVDCIEYPNLAIAGIAAAYLALGGYEGKSIDPKLAAVFQAALGVSRDEADGLAYLGRWFVTECQGAEHALPRLARKLDRLSGPDGLPRCMGVIAALTRIPAGALTPERSTALSDMRRIFRL
ncbi:MAG: hypothetical protein AAFN59_03275 [Pseudomonadota bacterium]